MGWGSPWGGGARNGGPKNGVGGPEKQGPQGWGGGGGLWGQGSPKMGVSMGDPKMGVSMGSPMGWGGPKGGGFEWEGGGQQK